MGEYKPPPTPLHDKLRANRDRQRIGQEFLDWLLDEAGLMICDPPYTTEQLEEWRQKHNEVTEQEIEEAVKGLGPGEARKKSNKIADRRESDLWATERWLLELRESRLSRHAIMAKFLDIDPVELENEKQALLKSVREAQGL